MENIDLFSEPFLKEKREIYSLQNQIAIDSHVRDTAINGFEKVAGSLVKKKLAELDHKEKILKLKIIQKNLPESEARLLKAVTLKNEVTKAEQNKLNK